MSTLMIKRTTITWTMVAVLLAIAYGCGDWGFGKESIRPVAQFSGSDIPTFSNMDMVNAGEHPTAIKWESDYYFTQHKYRWANAENGFAFFYITAMHSHADAVSFLLESLTGDSLSMRKDQPTVAGQVSYGQGSNFVRDNLAVRIITSTGYADQMPDIAAYIDKKLRSGKTFASVSQVKPVIKEFSANKEAAVRWSYPLEIETEDPNNNQVNYAWRFSNNPDYFFISKDTSDVYWFNSTIYTVNLELTLIVYNEYGFCADSTISVVRLISEL
jgi:hypothetical protein